MTKAITTLTIEISVPKGTDRISAQKYVNKLTGELMVKGLHITVTDIGYIDIKEKD